MPSEGAGSGNEGDPRDIAASAPISRLGTSSDADPPFWEQGQESGDLVKDLIANGAIIRRSRSDFSLHLNIAPSDLQIPQSSQAALSTLSRQ
ncbi:hypothetical protein KIPB_013903, partial [Kipferlia bialata]|eukprot:g13903.t1